MNYTLKISKELSKTLNELTELLSKNKELFKNNLEFQNSLNDFGKYIVRAHTETPDNLLNISRYGWFIDVRCEMKYSSELNRLIENNNYDLAEKSLISYYTENLSNIFRIISSRHPTRKHIFKEIERAYNQELFYLVIPVIFSQIDGICNDLTSKKFFLKKNYLPEVYPEMNTLHKGFTDLLLKPIKNSTPFNVWEKEINKFPVKLNRHEILHGVDTVYGNKTNFLKCISMLIYISDIVNELNKKTKHNTI